jgi:SAM-dependent methyltransferase
MQTVYKLWSQAKPYLPTPVTTMARETRYQALRLQSSCYAIAERFTPKVIAPGIPAPPVDLRVRVHGSGNLTTFIVAGERIASDIDAAMQGRHFRNALDFGCGCGRVLTYLHRLRPSNYTGIDVDQEAVEWSQKNITLANFIHGPERPPLPFRNGEFDFIFSISVFSHMDEQHCRMWADELTRLLAPDGQLLITTIAGPGFSFSPAERTSWFVANKCEWYGTTCMSADYAANLFPTLRLVSHVARGINDHQDAILFHKP